MKFLDWSMKEKKGHRLLIGFFSETERKQKEWFPKIDFKFWITRNRTKLKNLRKF